MKRYDKHGLMLQDDEPDFDAYFVRFDEANAEIARLWERIDGLVAQAKVDHSQRRGQADDIALLKAEIAKLRPVYEVAIALYNARLREHAHPNEATCRAEFELSQLLNEKCAAALRGEEG